MTNDSMKPSPLFAYHQAVGKGGIPKCKTSNFICPHCGAYAQQTWGRVVQLNTSTIPTVLSTRTASTPEVVMALCTSCSRETVFVGGGFAYPSSLSGPDPDADMPQAVRDDFEEARNICGLSPRGAAALLRLAIQKLCRELGSDKAMVNEAIGQLVADHKIPETVQKALDCVRVIGNEAVHPGVLDLRDDQDTVSSLFGLVNFIVAHGIGEPRRINAIYASLPSKKLDGIAQRDGKK